MAPGTRVVARRHRRARGNRQVHAARHVVGRHLPTVGDELPVELARVGPGVHHVGDLVGNADGSRLVLVGCVDLEARNLTALWLQLVRAIGARGCLPELRPAGREILHGGDRQLRVVEGGVRIGSGIGDVPVHAVERAVEVERPRLHDRDGAIGVDREIDVHAIDGIAAGMGSRRSGEQRQRRHDKDE